MGNGDSLLGDGNGDDDEQELKKLESRATVQTHLRQYAKEYKKVSDAAQLAANKASEAERAVHCYATRSDLLSARAAAALATRQKRIARKEGNRARQLETRMQRLDSVLQRGTDTESFGAAAEYIGHCTGDTDEMMTTTHELQDNLRSMEIQREITSTGFEMLDGEADEADDATEEIDGDISAMVEEAFAVAEMQRQLPQVHQPTELLREPERVASMDTLEARLSQLRGK